MAANRTYTITLTTREASIIRHALTDAAKKYREAAIEHEAKVQQWDSAPTTTIDAWRENADICDHVARRFRA